jgi:hypothetical protein
MKVKATKLVIYNGESKVAEINFDEPKEVCINVDCSASNESLDLTNQLLRLKKTLDMLKSQFDPNFGKEIMEAPLKRFANSLKEFSEKLNKILEEKNNENKNK